MTPSTWPPPPRPRERQVGLVAVITDDELGHAIATRIAELGISTDLLHFATGQQGVYLVHSDPHGERELPTRGRAASARASVLIIFRPM